MAIQDNLEQLCESKHYVDSDLELTFTLDKQRLQNSRDVKFNNRSSQCNLFSIICNGYDKSTGERVEILYDVLNIPDTSGLLMLNGGTKQVIEEQRSSTGWYVSKETKEGSLVHSIRFKKYSLRKDSTVLNIREAKTNMTSDKKQKIKSLGYDDYRYTVAVFCVNHRVEGERTYKSVEVKCELGLFLVALTGLSYADLIEKIGNNCSLPASLSKDYQCDVDRETALTKLYDKFVSKANDPNLKQIVISSEGMYDELFTRSLKDKIRKLDASAKNRLVNSNSFKTRALGMVLAEDLEVIALVNGEYTKRVINAEVYLDETLLDIIDRNEVDAIKVRYDNNIYTLKKYSTFEFRALGKIIVNDVVDKTTGNVIVAKNTILGEKELDELNKTNISSITIKDGNITRNLTRRIELDDFDERDLMLCLNTFFNAMDGYPYVDNEYSMENRKFVSIETSVYNMAELWLDDIVQQILSNYRNNSNNLKLSTAMQLVETDPNDLLSNYNSSVNKFVQSANITNPLAVQMNRVKTDMAGSHFSEDMRNIAPMSQGRIDPVVTPESSKVGVVLYRTVVSDLNSRGEVVTPFIEIENGRPKSTEPVYLSALEERDKYVLPFDESCFDVDENGNEFYKEFVYARHNDRTVKVHPSKITLQDYSTFQTCCIARALVPFRQCLAAKRQTMASNHQMQCLYTLRNERPVVCTGAESIEPTWKVTAKEILTDYFVTHNLAGQGVSEQTFINSYIRLRNVEELLGKRKVIFTVSGFPNYLIERDIMFMEHSDKMSIYSTRINTQQPRLEYRGNDIVFYDLFYDINRYDIEKYGEFGLHEVDDVALESGLGLGVNLTVCYKTFEGSTVDDAIVINEQLVGDGIFTCVNLYKVEYRLNNNMGSSDREETFGFNPESTSGIPKGMTSTGIPKIGTYLNPGDVVIAKYERRTNQGLTGKNETTFKDSYIYMSAVEEGEVVYSAIDNGIATVLISSLQSIEAGDKLTGRHGNKGVVGKIVPSHLMPFMEDGTPVDIILNPLGVPSRSNISQIFEAVIGMALKRKGKIGVIGGRVNPVELAKKLSEETNLTSMYLRDGRTGQYFKRPMNVGILYMLRSEHLVSHKINSLGFPDRVDGITCQPQKGRAVKGGNAIDEMTMDIFRAADCNHIHDAIMSYLSCDVATRSKVKSSIMSNPLSLQIEGMNDNNRFMEIMFKPFGIKVVTEGDSYVYRILTDEDVRKLAPRPIDLTDPAASLRDSRIFGTVTSMRTRMQLREQWGYIDLGCDMVNPFFVAKGIIADLLTIRTYRGVEPSKITNFTKLLDGSASFDVETHEDSEGNVTYKMMYYESEGTSVTKTNTYRSKSSIVTKPKGEYYGVDGIVKLLQISNLDDTIAVRKSNVAKIKASIAKLYEDNGIPNCTGLDDCLSQLPDKGQTTLRKRLESLEEEERKLSYVQAFKDSGMKLTDMIFRNYPVLPIIYRPEPIQGRYQDYDEYYKDICAAVSDNKISNSIEARTRIYKAILHLTGVTEDKDEPKNRTPILSKMAGTARSSSNISEDSHGVMRDDLSRRRVTNSGRTVIIPAADNTMDLLHVGIPELMAVDMWSHHLASYVNAKYNTDTSDGSNYYPISDRQWHRYMTDVVSGSIDDTNCNNGSYSDIAKIIKPSAFIKEMYELIEGNPNKGLEPQIVIFGRQPAFLINSARAYYVKLVKGKAIHIHPLACKAYNADFDGDQMWTLAVLDDECKKEAMEKLSYLGHMISSKDRSVWVDPQQDIRAGCYIATMLKDNRLDTNDEVYDLSNVHYYDDIELLGQNIEAGLLESYELVCYTHLTGNKYLSTAGRIMFNSILPDGFTDNEYTNVLGLPVTSDDTIGINLTGYKQLKYDGLLAKNRGNTHGLKYESLGDAVYSIVDSDSLSEHDKVAIMQKILQFGLYFSDTYGLSFTLEDLEGNPKKDAYVKAAMAACKQVEEDCNNGLIPEKVKIESIIEINNACTKKFTNVLVDEMPRTNNMFIMLDSGARGNRTQLNQAVGIIGVLSKSKTEKLEMPIYSNFSEGLSELELYGSSYAGRIGINSTQNETKVTGEMLRKAIFLASTVVVQEEDCGRDEEADDMYIKLVYTDLQSVVRIDEDSSKPDYEWESTPTNINDLTGYELADNGEWFDVHFKNFIKDGYLIREGLSLIQKYKVTLVNCKGCRFVLRYKLSDMSKTQLLYRRAFALPYMIDDEYISEDTIKYIEENNLKDIRVRTLFGCKSKNGVCSRCYGLLYTSRKLPTKGSNVAIESAQDIGESASQLTLDVVHSLGTKGGELSSGVKFLSNLLECSTGSFTGKIFCGTPAYAKVNSIGNFSLINIGDNYSIQLSKQSSNIIDGEYVDKYTQLSKGLINPNKIGTGSTFEDIMERQHAMLTLYYDTYAANGIFIMARHFEILVRGQGSVAIVTEDKGEYRAGMKYNLQELIENEVPYRGIMVSGNEAVKVNGGTMTALTTGDVLGTMKVAFLSQVKDKNNSSKGKTLAGESMVAPKRVSLSIETDLGDKNLNAFNKYSPAISKAVPKPNIGSMLGRRPRPNKTVAEPVIEKDTTPIITVIETPVEDVVAEEVVNVESEDVQVQEDSSFKKMSLF